VEDLSPYQLSIEPAPSPIRAAVAAGVRRGAFPPLSEAASVLCASLPWPDQAVRAADGRVLVTCTTELPGVSPNMIDWWFGWHLPSSARYRLWHPKAHVAARVREDRSHLPDDRARYTGNVSYVDEYIGKSLKKLAIEFVPPAEFGMASHLPPGSTAVCAKTSDRIMGGEGGRLIHLVLPTEWGAQMRSAFWLGEIEHQWPLLDRLMGGVLNTRTVRQLLVPDQMVLDLLQHCGEEMQHLGKFLPRLFHDQHMGLEGAGGVPAGPTIADSLLRKAGGR
jgi:hypothetical protein